MNETPTPREVLIMAREAIHEPENWRQGFPEPGKFTTAPWCAATAIEQVAVACPTAPIDEARQMLRDVIGEPTIHGWNDTSDRTHGEVLAAFDRAIGATP